MTIDEILRDADEKGREDIALVAAKYGDNHWWESEDLRELAYYQIAEPVLMCEFSDFHKGIERLLGRPVWTHEFGVNMDGLREEARKAYAGTFTEEERKIATRKGFESIAKMGKPFIAMVNTEGGDDD